MAKHTRPPASPPAASQPAIARAVAAYQNGAWAECERLCRAVLVAKPNHFDALHLSGIVAAQSGRLQDAVNLLTRAVAASPGNAEAHNNRGNALRELGRHTDALASYERAIALAPGFAQAHYNRGNTLYLLKRPADALQSYDRAIALAPRYADAHNNRGNALRDLGRHADALASYEHAIELQPDSADAWSNRGHVLRRDGRYQDAVASYLRAIEIDPQYAAAHFDLALCRLLLGDYAAGWEGYEWRWKKAEHASLHRGFAEPQWTGTEPLDGRTVFLYAEQGLGTTLQFCRYASLVAARGARVILEVPRLLAPLLASLDGVAQIVVPGAPLPAFDYHCPLLSLPHAFRTDLASVPAAVPYLRSDPARVTHWRAMLGERSKPRVGLVWSGSLLLEADKRSARSLSLAELLPLASDRMQFVSVQKDVPAHDAAVLASHPEVLALGAQLADFADTAALVELLDVVVTVDTSVAHLAGAMGKPVWIMLEHSPDWRWLLAREDSPWYPTAKLFRQDAPGDWAGVVERVRGALLRLQDNPVGAPPHG
jgi:Flp pilus assembly protein TadD